MPLKEGACRACNDTEKCSVCGGTGIRRKDGETCPCCKGTGKCQKCVHRDRGTGGWGLDMYQRRE